MKAIPAELEAKIIEVKSWMMDGDQNEVAKRAGVPKSWVSDVLNRKKYPTGKILDAAIKVMNENKRRFEINQSMKIAS
jgi:hypothetical protein